MTQSAPSSLVQNLDRALAWHQELRATIAKLDAAFKAWEVSPRLAAPWRHFSEGMEDHLRVEEEILFPALRALAEGRDPEQDNFEVPLLEMRYELDELATISDALRSASPEARELEGELLEMLDQLDVHAEKEQNVIVPEGMRLLVAWRTGARDAEAPEPAPTRAPPPRDTRPEPEHGLLFRLLRRFKRLAR